MITEEFDFSQLLEMFFSWGGYTTTKVARLSGVPKTTLDTWLAGGTKRPRNGQQIVELCRALELTESDANRLLNSAGHKTIREFHEVALKKNNTKLIDLVGYWLNAVVKSSEIDAPFLAPSRRIDQLFGRDKLVWQIEKVLQDGEYCVLHGMPGVGKTSLAVELAYRVANYFPDGVLWADLSHVGGGDSEEDTERLMACLYTFIRAYGREAQQAVTLESREVLWREVVQNKRALLIFDNVAHTAVLQRLLPPDNNRSVVLVTTNNQRVLHGRAQAIPVHVLPFEASQALLRYRLGSDGDRVETEAVGVKRVIELVDGHPLALELVASGVSYITFQEYVRELEDEQTRLDYLADWDDVNKSVKGVFQMSFNRLSERERHLFAHTALFQSGHFTAEAMAYLLDQNGVHAKRLLGRLCQTSFLTTGRLELSDGAGITPQNRYHVHNLLRIFALYQSRLLDFDRPQLWERLSDYYTKFAETKGETQAYGEIDDEWENIQSTLEQMVKHEDIGRVWLGILGLTRYWVGAFGYMDLRAKYEPTMNWMLWLKEQGAKLEQQFSDEDLADLTVRLGWFSFRLNHRAQAEQYLERDLPAFERGGDVERALLRRGFAADVLSRIKIQTDIEEARDLLESSISQLERFETPAVRYQQAHLRIGLGEVLAKSFGRMESALGVMEKGLGDLPDRITPSHLKGLINSSIVATIMNQRDKGDSYMDQAIVAARDLGDLRNTGLGLLNKGVSMRKNGDLIASKAYYQQATVCFHQIGDQYQLGIVQYNLGRIHLMLGEYADCHTALELALQLAINVEDKESIMYVELLFAELYMAQQRWIDADDQLQQLLLQCREQQNTLLMPYVQIRLGEIRLQFGDHEDAWKLVKIGLQLAQSKQDSEAEGIALSCFAEILEARGELEGAADAHHRAVTLLEKQDMYEHGIAEARLAEFRARRA